MVQLEELVKTLLFQVRVFFNLMGSGNTQI
jgi:hypothetical protein